MWSICGREVKEGEKQTLMLNIGAKDEYLVPVTLINGVRPGKTIMFSAQIHSMENIGTVALNRLSAMLDPADVCGQIIMFHCVNISGYWKRHIRFVPEDGKNLNAVFPGKGPDGTISDQIADYFIKNVYEHVDFICDIHSGAPGQPLENCVFYPKALREIMLPIVKDLNVHYIFQSRSKGGLYSYPANYCNVPGIILERGTGGFVYKEWVDEDIKDALRILKYFGVYESDVEPSAEKHIWYSMMDDLFSDVKGNWYPVVELHQHVKKGDLYGVVEDFFGNRIKEFRAEEDGTVVYYTNSPQVEEGSMLVSYAYDRDLEDL